ncbi:MAG: tRNA (adenosine(37)-N6)-threonylcarbamoyltransferase complex ATPase subunit type 1 TsaE [Halieaceae bacterium]|nr:tRNA (adenosine(37)-N6)-threonylcarbamoyltransferase complex ATPase subunit type 1 TsaE [Halieaceae bacterium]
MKILRLHIRDEEAMVELGRTVAPALTAGTALYLYGDLGAGKTTLARGLARGLGHAGAVKSPTYTLVEPYLDLALPLYHFDLYRLGDPEELEYLGVRDYFDGAAITLVEWPQRGGDFLPTPDLEISIADQGDGRRVEIRACSDRGLAALARLGEGLAAREQVGDGMATVETGSAS